MIQAAIAQQALDKASKSKVTPYIIGGVILIGIGTAAVVYFKVYKPMLCKIGLADCTSGKVREIVKYKGFDPDYASTFNITLSIDRAKTLAQKIKDAGRWYGDKEEDFYQVLREAGSAHNLSLIARMFAAKNWGSLADHITEYMGTEQELKRIKDIIDNY